MVGESTKAFAICQTLFEILPCSWYKRAFVLKEG